MMNGDGPARGDAKRKGSFFNRLMNAFSGEAAADEAESFSENGDDEGGAPNEQRRAMIERVIDFDGKKVVDVMAPRADIYAVEIETPLPDLVREFADAGHSRMPIYRGDLDDPVGMAHIKDVVRLISEDNACAPSEQPVLASIRRDVLYAPPSMPVTDLLLRMQASRIHMALVIDEYGGTDGLVTIEDLIEEIVGEINDEHDVVDDPSVRAANDGGWDADARVELEDFAEETGILLEAEDDEVDTVGGYVVSMAGRVPQRGEVIAGGAGLDFEVVEADARKVRRLRIRPAAAPKNEAAE
ncbi:MAG: hemolysin family protein [Pseudomonadota bacterium]